MPASASGVSIRPYSGPSISPISSSGLVSATQSTLISAILAALCTTWRRCPALAAVRRPSPSSAILIGGMVPLCHIGRPVACHFLDDPLPQSAWHLALIFVRPLLFWDSFRNLNLSHQQLQSFFICRQSRASPLFAITQPAAQENLPRAGGWDGRALRVNGSALKSQCTSWPSCHRSRRYRCRYTLSSPGTSR